MIPGSDKGCNLKAHLAAILNMNKTVDIRFQKTAKNVLPKWENYNEFKQFLPPGWEKVVKKFPK